MRVRRFMCLTEQTRSDSNSCGFFVKFLFRFFFSVCFNCLTWARLRDLGEAAQRKALAWDELAYGRGLLDILCPRSIASKGGVSP